MNFIIALGQCVLAGAFASYYWAWDKKTVSTGENVNGTLHVQENNYQTLIEFLQIRMRYTLLNCPHSPVKPIN